VPVPAVVLLDPKLPRMSGVGALGWTRTERRVPVVVPTSSRLREDAGRAYELGSSACVVKPAAPAALPLLMTGVTVIGSPSTKGRHPCAGERGRHAARHRRVRVPSGTS